MLTSCFVPPEPGAGLVVEARKRVTIGVELAAKVIILILRSGQNTKLISLNCYFSLTNQPRGLIHKLLSTLFDS